MLVVAKQNTLNTHQLMVCIKCHTSPLVLLNRFSIGFEAREHNLEYVIMMAIRFISEPQC